jgi:hypothetical protein
MAMNERIEITSNDLSAAQQAPSQASRVNFTPGKATGKIGDMNWTKDYRVPTGTPAFDGESAGPATVTRVRVVKLGRNTVCDQTLESVPASPANTIQENDGRKERKSGNDWAQA